MFELTKLKATNMFTSSRRLARQIKKAQKGDEEQERAIEAQLLKIDKDYQNSGDPREIYRDFDKLTTAIRAYFSATIYKEEENAELYILREEEDLEELFRGLKDLFEHFKATMPEDQEDIKRIASLLNSLYNEGVRFKDKMQKEFRKIRDQKRDHERFRDRMFQVRQEFHQRIAAQHLKKDAKKHKKKEQSERKDIKSLEHHVKAIKKLKNKGEATQKEEQELHRVIEALGKDITKDLQLLEETLKEVATIIDYAVYHYFKAQDLKEQCRQEIEKLKSRGLWASTAKDLERLFDDLNTWQDQQERKEYRIARKIKRAVKNDVSKESTTKA